MSVNSLFREIYAAEKAARTQERVDNDGDADAIRRSAIRSILRLGIGEPLPSVEDLLRRFEGVQTEWDAEAEGNKLILLFEGYLYGDLAVNESMVVAAIHRFRTKQPVWLNPDSPEFHRAEAERS